MKLIRRRWRARGVQRSGAPQRGRKATWRVAAGLAVGLAAAVAVSGCSAGSDQGNRSSTEQGAAAPGPAPAEGGDLMGGKPAEKPAQQPAEAPGGVPAKLRLDERAIVYTGSITVRVDDVDKRANEVTAIATGAGGFVGADKRTASNGRSSASVTLRVPAARFGAVVDQIANLGRAERRDVNTEDVTEAIVDVDARIATQQASVTRTRALLARARTIGEIVSLESELTKREAELASLQARKRRLADLTTLSTITAELLGPKAESTDEDEPDTGFVAGLKAGWKAFLASMEVLLTVLGALLPWALALGIPLYALIWLFRRLRRRPRATVPAPAAAAATPVTLPPPPAHKTPPRPAP